MIHIYTNDYPRTKKLIVVVKRIPGDVEIYPREKGKSLSFRSKALIEELIIKIQTMVKNGNTSSSLN